VTASAEFEIFQAAEEDEEVIRRIVTGQREELERVHFERCPALRS
jgi:hypothetical protein